MHIVYYISSHGYGHGVRSCAICNRLSNKVELTVRSLLPEQFFFEELSRSFHYYPDNFDCGCIQTDCVTVDIEKTLQTYMKIADRNREMLEKESKWCRDNKITGIVSDIASFPFEAGKKAGIPSVGVSNFSWEDIYEPYLSVLPEFEPYFKKIQEQYHMADLLLALDPPNPMKSFKNSKNVPVVGRKGRNRNSEVRARYKIDSDKKIGLIYTGDFGMDTVSWKKLERFDEWEFVGGYPLPGNPSNYHLATKDDFTYQDISASVDCMISKIGYGVYSECLINGVPLLYLPRSDFSEYPVLEQAVREWGYGYCISYDDFSNLQWGPILEKVKNIEPPRKNDLNGDLVCAGEIESLFSKLIV